MVFTAAEENRSHKMLSFISVMINVFVLCHSQVLPIDNYKEQILNLHNDYRAVQKGSNMQEMTWDDTLAKEAQDWVDQCRFAHQSKGRGENLAFEANSKTVEEKINSSMQSWYDEIRSYNYHAKACGSSCHYVQVVWAKTKIVGCGMKVCDLLQKSFGRPTKNAWYLACFYFPKGNDISQYPYNKGTPCSECEEGQTCNKKGECTGGPEPDLFPCENTNKMCQQWKVQGQCTSNRPYMEKDCAKACGFCTKAGATADDEDELSCEDENTQCASWAKTGQCKGNPNYMNVSCRKSCGAC